MEEIKRRTISFAYEAGGLLITGLASMALSPEFSALVHTHYGETFTASIILLVITGLAKSWRNDRVKKKLGSTGRKILI